MLTWTLRIGESIKIGDAVLVRVQEKSGRKVKLNIATSLSPITHIGMGIDIAPIVQGITGEPRPMRILDAVNR